MMHGMVPYEYAMESLRLCEESSATIPAQQGFIRLLVLATSGGPPGP